MAAAALAGEDELNLGILDAGMAGMASCRIAISLTLRGENGLMASANYAASSGK